MRAEGKTARPGRYKLEGLAAGRLCPRGAQAGRMAIAGVGHQVSTARPLQGDLCFPRETNSKVSLALERKIQRESRRRRSAEEPAVGRPQSNLFGRRSRRQARIRTAQSEKMAVGT